MVETGETAPSFTLASTAGGEVRLQDELRSGPVVVLTNRGYWCSYCAEQLQTFSQHAYDLWRNHGTTILPTLGDPLPKLVEMRDRFDLHIQLLADPDLEVAGEFAGTEHSDRHGEIPLAGTVIIDGEGVVRYRQVARNPSDRTYANYARHFIVNGMDAPYSGGESGV